MGLMGFECVVRALRSGYMIRRPHWKPEEHLESGTILDKKTIFYATADHTWEYSANPEDILATDWERYVERKSTEVSSL